MERFWNKVKRTESCWLWQASVNALGYGLFRANGKIVTAHRFSYILNYGKIPNGLHILHHCDTPPCVRPDHLYSGTHLENMKDKKERGRVSRQCGENHPKSKLTNGEVREIRKLKGRYFQYEIAKIYGVTKGCINHIMTNRQWSTIT